MLFEPYPHQLECLDAIENTRVDGQSRALVVMASGLGKTVMAAHDARRWLGEYGGRLLYLCHQNDILTQARTTYEIVLQAPYAFGYFHGKEKSIHKVDCLFASFQTMRNYKEYFRRDEFSYIVVDESHHSPAPTYLPVLEYFSPKFLLGLTATPERTDLTDIRSIYGTEVFWLPLEDALVRGLLTPVDYRLMTDELQNLEVLDTVAGKLSIRYLNKKIFVPRRDSEIAAIILRHMSEIENPKAMIFCPSIRYCERLQAYLPNALAIHTDLPLSLQERRLEAFRQGLINIAITIDKFNEGIDIPDVNIVVFLRSTSSRTIFFQQLGRGLRRIAGKDRVRIIDFVGNCDRLQTVSDLWRSVEEKRGEYKKDAEGADPLSIDVGEIQFTEEIKRIVDLLPIIRAGYTQEILIRQLQELAQQLGRAPTSRDVQRASAQGRCASFGTFLKIFTSFGRALEVAGFAANIRHYTREELITAVQTLARELGRVPKVEDINRLSRAGKGAHYDVFHRVIGSWNAVLIAAGFSVQGPIEPKRYSKEELVSQVQQLHQSLGRVPTRTDVDAVSKLGKGASRSTFVHAFGSWSEALKAAGLRGISSKAMTREELLLQFRALADELGHTPNTMDLLRAHEEGKCAHPGTFQSIGTLAEIQRAAGLEVTARWSKEELADKLKLLARDLGRTPNGNDIVQAAGEGKVPSLGTFKHVFGKGLSGIQEEVGLPSTRHVNYTRKDLLDQLKALAIRLGRRPRFGDIWRFYKEGLCASPATFYSRFSRKERAEMLIGRY